VDDVLTIDRGTVSREGYPDEVKLYRRHVKLSLNLFMLLLNSGDQGYPADDLKEKWRDLGGAHKPTKTAIWDAITDLRKLLKPLEVTIYLRVARHYVLADLESK
jgi:hypothetical protein